MIEIPKDREYLPPVELDATIIGAGFSGLYFLYELRKLGLSAKIFDNARKLGGTWYWNSYPGARVDSAAPIYEWDNPEIYKDWKWSEEYPGWQEIQKYFEYIGSKLDLYKDTQLETTVTHAFFDEDTDKWHIFTDKGDHTISTFFLPCVGFASKKYVPAYKNLEAFKGEMHHTCRWPESGVDLRGKRIAVIGTGASGVQAAQDSAPEAAHLTVFQRTPNMALPMKQHKFDEDHTHAFPNVTAALMNLRRFTYAGFQYTYANKSLFDDTPEEREAFLEDLYNGGGFRFWLGTYRDATSNKEANDIIYDFWKRKTRQRVKDPKVAEMLAPDIPPHPWGCKRVSLEQRYYEIFNQDNVELVDVNRDPIVEFTEKGIKTKEREFEFDLIILATGYDAVTGSLKQMDIRGLGGLKIADKWKDSTRTFLGVSLAGFPNLFYTYGPQAPTAFSNGPSCIEVQVQWIMKVIKFLTRHGKTRIVPIEEAEHDYSKFVNDECNKTLLPLAKSWYMGANIPGKTVESLNFTAGIPKYCELMEDSWENDLKGFIVE